MNGFYKRQNPHRLYRNKHDAMVAGVCSGIAEYAGFNRKGTRLAIALLTLFPPLTAFMLVSYFVLALVLPVKPIDLYETKEQEEFWQGVNQAPSDVFGSLRHRFRELNRRLEKMEAYVTSKEFEFDHELGRNHK
jgi:phage shock protein C